MPVCIVGDIKVLPQDFYETLSADDTVVVSSNQNPISKAGRRLLPYQIPVGSKRLRKLFDVYNFSSVVFVSKSLDGRVQGYGENYSMQKLLELCADYHVPHFVFLTSTLACSDLSDQPGDVSAQISFLRAAENLCELYRTKAEMQIHVVRVPHLFSHSPSGFWIDHVARSCARGEAVQLPLDPEGSCGFLAVQDLLSMLRILFLYPPEGLTEMNLSSGETVYFSEIGRRAAKAGGQVEFAADGQPPHPPAVQTPELRQATGWVPLYTFQSSFAGLVEPHRAEKAESSSPRRLQNIWKRAGKHRFVIKLLEVLFLFVLTELLNRSFASMNGIYAFDFRLILILLVANMNGMAWGVFTASLSVVSLIWEYVHIGMDWRILFYNIENWVPFALYICLGCIIGFQRSKGIEALRVQEDKYDLLREKYEFLNRIYTESISVKKRISRQLINNQNSFAKVYDVSHRLASVIPERVFAQALQVLHETLANETLAVYRVPAKTRTAYLSGCTSQAAGLVENTLLLEDWQDVLDEFVPGKVWSNRPDNDGRPAHVMPLYDHDGQLVGMLMLYALSIEQASASYLNLFEMLGNMIQDALANALLYQRKMQKEWFVRQTTVMRPEHFYTVLQIEREKEKMGYIQLRLKSIKKEMLASAEELEGQLEKGYLQASCACEGNDWQLLYLSSTNPNALLHDAVETAG